MNIGTLSLALVGGFGLGISGVLGFYLLSKKKELSEVLLAILLIFLSFRIAKSVFYNFVDLPLFIKNLGLAFNLAVGPILLFYGKALLNGKFQLKPLDCLHFIPALIYVVFSNQIPNGAPNLIWNFSYGLILLQFFIYLGFSTQLVVRNNSSSDSNWFRGLIFSLTIINFVYLFIHINVIPYYAAGIISFTFLMVFIAVGVFNRADVSPHKKPKYLGREITNEEARSILELIKSMMVNERMYLNNSLTIDDMATMVDIPKRAISQAINGFENTNFVTFINRFRLEESKRLLSNHESKIAAVAYNSGFKSISAFNEAFKNQMNITPSQYRKQL